MRNGGWCRHQPPLSQFLLSSSEELDVRCRAVRVSAFASLLRHPPFRIPVAWRSGPAGLSLESGFGLRLSLLPRLALFRLSSAKLRSAWPPSPEASGLNVRIAAASIPFRASFAFARVPLDCLRESGFGLWPRASSRCCPAPLSLPSPLRMPASLAAPLPEALVRCLAAAPGHKRKLTGRSDSRQRNPPVDN
jgi:hypothetical protein